LESELHDVGRNPQDLPNALNRSRGTNFIEAIGEHLGQGIDITGRGSYDCDAGVVVILS
jgi:hypothetical protein